MLLSYCFKRHFLDKFLLSVQLMSSSIKKFWKNRKYLILTKGYSKTAGLNKSIPHPTIFLWLPIIARVAGTVWGMNRFCAVKQF